MSQHSQVATEQPEVEESEGYLKNYWKVFKRKKPALFSFYFILFLLLLVVLGPYIVPYNPSEPDYGNVLDTPSWQHIFGTDVCGRGILIGIFVGVGFLVFLSVLVVCL